MKTRQHVFKVFCFVDIFVEKAKEIIWLPICVCCSEQRNTLPVVTFEFPLRKRLERLPINYFFFFFLPVFSISLWEFYLISFIFPEIFSPFVTRDLAEVMFEIKEPSYGKILVEEEIFIDVYV